MARMSPLDVLIYRDKESNRMSITIKMKPSTFPKLVRMLKLYALVAFILPFPVAYWTDSLRIDLFALFYFPIAADKLEETKSGSVAAWLFGITMVYFLATSWTLITLISHILGNDESVYGSMSILLAGSFSILYASFAWYGFGLVRGLNKLLQSAKINTESYDTENKMKSEPHPSSKPPPSVRTG